MADYTTRQVTTHYTEVVLPNPTNWVEMHKALNAAEALLVKSGGSTSDNAVEVSADEEEIVLRFKVPVQPELNCPECGEKGHLSHDCPLLNADFADAKSNAVAPNAIAPECGSWAPIHETFHPEKCHLAAGHEAPHHGNRTRWNEQGERWSLRG